MNRSALFGFWLLFPLICALYYGLTRWLDPLLGYALGLVGYWLFALIPLMVWHRRKITWPARPFWPHWSVTLVQGVMLAGVILALGAAFGDGLRMPFWVAGCVVLMALCNGTLEELFWRGTVLGGTPTWPQAGLALLAFTAWHIALLFSAGVITTGGAIGLLGGAFAGGAIWTVARMQTGNTGFACAGHVLLNVFAFSELALRNL